MHQFNDPMRVEASGNLGIGVTPGYVPPPMSPAYHFRRQSSSLPIVMWFVGAMFGISIFSLVARCFGT
jgi:hypothetical protein